MKGEFSMKLLHIISLLQLNDIPRVVCFDFLYIYIMSYNDDGFGLVSDYIK